MFQTLRNRRGTIIGSMFQVMILLIVLIACSLGYIINIVKFA